MVKKDGKTWTGKFGVFSEQQFLNNPVAQEKALEAFMQDAQRQFTVFGIWQKAGLSIQTTQGPVTVTENGLLAAAHKEGPPRVRDYVRHVEGNGGRMNPSLKGTKLGDSFEKIEERLRDFAHIDHRARP